MSELLSAVSTPRRAPIRPPPASSAVVTDEDLMARSQGGDTEAFSRLYDRHARLTLGLTRSICGSDLAEDAVQGAFLSAWTARASFSPSQGSFRSWICRICRNRALDLVRADRVHGSRRNDDPEALARHLARNPQPAGAPEHIVESAEEEAGLRAALLRLPEAQREVIVLAYFAGMTHAEIAKVLGEPHGTIKGRMRLGLTRLRRDPVIAIRSRVASTTSALPAPSG